MPQKENSSDSFLNAFKGTEQPKDDGAAKTFAEVFQSERENWKNIVKAIGQRFRNVENLTEVQVDLYSRRQEAIEYQFRLIASHTRLKKAYAAEWKKAFDGAGKNQDLRYNDKDKARIADAAVLEIKYKVDSVQNHIDYFRETVKTIDNMIFGVKHRIEIENFKIGMK